VEKLFNFWKFYQFISGVLF